jgi:hypothetical protein
MLLFFDYFFAAIVAAAYSSSLTGPSHTALFSLILGVMPT